MDNNNNNALNSYPIRLTDYHKSYLVSSIITKGVDYMITTMLPDGRVIKLFPFDDIICPACGKVHMDKSGKWWNIKTTSYYCQLCRLYETVDINKIYSMEIVRDVSRSVSDQLVGDDDFVYDSIVNQIRTINKISSVIDKIDHLFVRFYLEGDRISLLNQHFSIREVNCLILPESVILLTDQYK